MTKPPYPHPNYPYGWSRLTNDYLSQIEHYLYNANPPDPSVLRFPSFLDHLFTPFSRLQEVYLTLRWNPDGMLIRHQVRSWLTEAKAYTPELGSGQWQFIVASLTLVEILNYIVDNWDLHNPEWIPKIQLSSTWVALDQIVTEERIDFPLTAIVDKMGKGNELQEKAERDTAAIQTLRDELARRVGEDNVSPVLTKIEGEEGVNLTELLEDTLAETEKVQFPVQGAEGHIHHVDLDPEVVQSEKLRDELTEKCHKAVEDHINYTASLEGTSKEEIELKERYLKERIANERALDLKLQLRPVEPNGDTAPTPEAKEAAKKKVFDEIERSSQASRLQELRKRETALEENRILIAKELEGLLGEFLKQPHSCTDLGVTAVTLGNCPICAAKRQARKLLDG